MGEMVKLIADEPYQPVAKSCPAPPPPPPFPDPLMKSKSQLIITSRLAPTTAISATRVSVCRTTRDIWERLFDEGYKSDVQIITGCAVPIFAHSNILGMASPVLRGMLKQAKMRDGQRSISVNGVPHDAIRVFIRFLYSSCYEKEEMEEYVLHLMVLAHVFVVPELKEICIHSVETGFLTMENVVDILQLALLCDAPRLSLVCHRMIINNFKEISSTEGWRAMKQSHPVLETELLESMIEADNREKERVRRSKERKMYMQLYEAMEALVHICRDGCRRIGPYGKELERNQEACNNYGGACRGLEQLVRHFSGCKQRVAGGCSHCKRMGQLLELHSRLCADSSICRVPLCRDFKERMRKQSKKDETRWRILVKNILKAKAIRGSPFFLSSSSTSYI
ncbi:BTB/POZ and TAZ domain-containing protein 4 [Linum grandiflorum]